MFDELFVVEVRGNYFSRHGIGERNIGTDVYSEPQISEFGRCRSSGIDGEHFGTFRKSLKDVVEEDRVRVPCIRPPQQNKIRVFHLGVRRGSAASSKHCRQTDDARCVSSSVTGVNVVRTHSSTHKFLCRVVHFVGALRTTEETDCLMSAVVDGLTEPGGSTSKCLIPSRFPKFSVFTNQGFGDAS